MHLRQIPASVAAVFIITLSMGILAADAGAASFGDTIRRDFDIDGTPKRLYYRFTGFSSLEQRKVEKAKVQFADWAQEAWTFFEQRGFKSPYHEIEDGVETLRFIHEKADCCFGSAGPDGPVYTFGPLNSSDEETNLQLQISIVHETFHAVQFNYANFGRYTSDVSEGMATYIPELFNRDTRQLILDEDNNCSWIYLSGSQGSLFFRPGGGSNHSNVCATSLWWKYVAQQFAYDDLDPRAGELDTMRRLLESLEYFGGWRSRDVDDLLFAEDFNADDIDDLFARSDLYMGILSRPFWEPRTWDVKADGGRIDSGWKFHRDDRTPASCDFVGDSGKEILIVSRTHIAALAVDRQGRFRNGPITGRSALVVAGAPMDLERAEFLAGDFDGDAKCEVLVKHPAGLTLLDVDSNRFTPTVGVAVNERLGTGGWRHRPVDRLIAAGDFDGDGRDEFLLSNARYVGAGGLDASGSELITEAANGASYRLPGSAVPIGIAEEDRVFTGRFGPADKELIAKAGSSGVLFFSLRGDRPGFQLEASRARGIAPGAATSMLVADLDGDGTDVLVERGNSGAVSALRPAFDLSVDEVRLLEFGDTLVDGENGSCSRPSFTILADLELEASGDFNGDGTEDLAVRSGAVRQVLYAREIDGDIQFTIDKPIADEARYYGLAAGLDRFIRANSGSGRAARTLNSTFEDFALANLLTNSSDPGPRHRYAEPDDAETLTYHETLTSAGYGDRRAVQQDPWAISYIRVENPFNLSRTRIEASVIEPQVTPRFHLLVFAGDRVTGRYSRSGSYFSQEIALDEDQHAVLIAVSFEAPLKFDVSVTP